MVEERFKDCSSTPGIQDNLKEVLFNREGAVVTWEHTLFSIDVNEKESIKSN